MCDLSKKLNDIINIQEELKKYRESLNSELSIIDKEIVDIEHYIEFYNFNAAQGYNAYKMLKDRFVRRREIKNDLERINLIWNNKINAFSGSVTKQIEKVEDKKYKARVLKSLFAS